MSAFGFLIGCSFSFEETLIEKKESKSVTFSRDVTYQCLRRISKPFLLDHFPVYGKRRRSYGMLHAPDDSGKCTKKLYDITVKMPNVRCSGTRWAIRKSRCYGCHETGLRQKLLISTKVKSLYSGHAELHLRLPSKMQNLQS